MNLKTAQERYENDSTFHELVRLLENMIQSLQISPSEVREAAMFAVMRVELRNPNVALWLARPEQKESLAEFYRRYPL